MPTYQYACTGCGKQTEAVQSFTDAALTECLACGGRLRKVYSAVGVVFKGSGFYKNDSRPAAGNGDKPAEKKADAPAAASAGSSSSSGESSSSSGGASSKTEPSSSDKGSSSSSGSGASTRSGSSTVASAPPVKKSA